MLTSRTIESPVGPLTIAGVDGVVHHLRMDAQTYPPEGQGTWCDDDTAFDDVAEQLDSYFTGERTTFDVSLHFEGTDFQRRVWHALLEIPFGETRTYGALAAQLGSPGAARAVGLANGHNPIGIIVPCHRVIGADGSLTGYGGGVDRKRRLLDHERSVTGGPLTLFA
ncbi:MAG: methylated-DNA-[protein]-cysteine S-methyltransferase [Actinomycetota bacterium]|jgi:methylated-DNA-[protein]-cysteine S-methyltransferase